jgi:hypothetical protein
LAMSDPDEDYKVRGMVFRFDTLTISQAGFYGLGVDDYLFRGGEFPNQRFRNKRRRERRKQNRKRGRWWR